MARYRAVLFDWMLTLAHYPSDSEFCVAALQSLGRDVDPVEVESVVAAVRVAETLDAIAEVIAVMDTSEELHRTVSMKHLEVAGVDIELASAWYALLGRHDMHPLYPDAGAALADLHQARVRIAVISDIHVDLREHAEGFGISEFVDHWSLSFELGTQKPNPEMFRNALDALGLEPADALVVGDRVSHDGAAAELGIDTLILPARHSFGNRGLDRVVQLVRA